jgi:hypothetical protein
MKNVAATIGFATLLLAGTTQAQITINGWTSGKTLLSSFAPKLASDTQNDVVTIAGTGKGLSALETQLGSYLDLPTRLSWAGSTNFIFSPSQQIGQGASIALAFGGPDLYDVAIEMHQGGQESGSSLWFQLGSGAPPLSSGINWQPTTQFGPGPWACGPYPRGCGAGRFDYGYSPTVAADNDEPPSSTTTVLEVHQSAATGESTLYYHVGILTLSASPSITWGQSLQVSATTQGSAPTVSISNNVAVLVFQGSGGALLYSTGVVDPTTSTIAWTEPVSYDSGYSPTISVSGDGTGLPRRVLVEAHQVGTGTGSLVYSTGAMIGPSPTSIIWSSLSGTPANIAYATGCSPSVALAFAGHTLMSQVSATETHACGGSTATDVEAFFGHLVGK